MKTLTNISAATVANTVKQAIAKISSDNELKIMAAIALMLLMGIIKLFCTWGLGLPILLAAAFVTLITNIGARLTRTPDTPTTNQIEIL